MNTKKTVKKGKGNIRKTHVSGSSQTKGWVRPTQDKGKCLHNVGSQDVDGYFRCLYCGAVVKDDAIHW